MTTQSLGSIVGRGDLIRKIRIPRWIIVFSSSILALISLGLNLVIVAIVMALNRVPLQSTIMLLPLLLVEIYIFGLGISFFLSAAFVRFRDISYIWEVLLQAGIYLTPILYVMTLIPSLTLRKLMLLNPMAQAIQDARFAVISHDPKVLTTYRVFDGGWYVILPVILVILVFVGGVLYFRGQANDFAENI
jgi:ABC-2 type transport system permease protein